MFTNPYLNAVLASVYIVAVVTLISAFEGGVGEETILIPMGMLSLLVLSVAIMGFLFFYQPLTLVLDGKRADAMNFFLRTLATFAGLTLALLIMVGFGI